MPDFNISNATTSNYGSTVGTVAPGSKNTDATSGQEEYIYQNNDWAKQWGYFNEIPELKSALLMKSCWNVGKGYTADSRTTAILDHISGWGKDTFTDILFNMDLISRLSGDSYAEIIKDPDTDLLLNLKVLNPGNMRIIINSKGIIKRYEQINDITKAVTKFEPKDILHLSHNRLADQCHGISDIISLQNTIDAEYENFADMKKLMHLQVRPLILWKLKTDNAAKIAAFVAKVSNARKYGDDMFIPDDENTVSHEVVQLNPSSMIMEWRTDIRNKFYRALGLPQIVFGTSGSTESGGKMEYLAHEQVFEHDQRFLEQQIWNQLFLKIDLISPVSLLENLQTDQSKDGAAQMMNMQQNDVTAGVGS